MPILTGQVFDTAGGTADLTAIGVVDWIKWTTGGANTALTATQRKATGNNQIAYQAYNVAGVASDPGYWNDTAMAWGHSWTDGTPEAVGNNNSFGLISDFDFGAKIVLTFPAGTATRTVRVYFDSYHSGANVEISLSDASVANTTYIVPAPPEYTFIGGTYIDVTYQAASNSQTMSVSVINGPSSDVTAGTLAIQAAAIMSEQTVNLIGSATANVVTSKTAALTSSIRLAGAQAAFTTRSASVNTAIQMAGVRVGAANTSASLTNEIKLRSVVTDLTQSYTLYLTTLSGGYSILPVMMPKVTVTASLTVPNDISSSVGGISAVTSTLTVPKLLQAVSNSVVTANATGLESKTYFNASLLANVVANSALTTSIILQTPGVSSSASSSAALNTAIRLNSVSADIVDVSGSISTTIRLASPIVAVADTRADTINTQIRLGVDQYVRSTVTSNLSESRQIEAVISCSSYTVGALIRPASFINDDFVSGWSPAIAARWNIISDSNSNSIAPTFVLVSSNTSATTLITKINLSASGVAVTNIGAGVQIGAGIFAEVNSSANTSAALTVAKELRATGQILSSVSAFMVVSNAKVVNEALVSKWKPAIRNRFWLIAGDPVLFNASIVGVANTSATVNTSIRLTSNFGDDTTFTAGLSTSFIVSASTSAITTGTASLSSRVELRATSLVNTNAFATVSVSSLAVNALVQGAANTTAALTGSIVLRANTAASVVTSASPTTRVALVANISTLGFTSGSLIAYTYMAGVVAGRTNVGATLTTNVVLDAETAQETQMVAALEAAINLRANTNVNAFAQAGLDSSIVFAANTTVLTTVSSNLTNRIRLNGAPATSEVTVSASLTNAVRFSANSTAEANVWAGTLETQIPISASVNTDIITTSDLTIFPREFNVIFDVVPEFTAQLSTEIIYVVDPIVADFNFTNGDLTTNISLVGNVESAVEANSSLTTEINLQASQAANTTFVSQLRVGVLFSASTTNDIPFTANVTTRVALAAAVVLSVQFTPPVFTKGGLDQFNAVGNTSPTVRATLTNLVSDFEAIGVTSTTVTAKISAERTRSRQMMIVF